MKKELEVLLDIMYLDCYDGKDENGNMEFCSNSISAYADALRLLAEDGIVRITKKISDRWIIAVEVRK